MCDKAELELTKVYAAGNALPGAFNKAASTIFGGSYAGTYVGNSAWAQDLDLDEFGMRDEEARVTFMVGMAILGTDEQYELLTLPERGVSSIQVTQDESTGLEIISIKLPTNEAEELYTKENEILKNKLELQPLGKLICRAWNIENFHEYDLPKDQFPDGKLPRVDENKMYEFWVEGQVLRECFEGMKMDARVRTLEGGISILDEVKEVMCSFWKWLPNELWMERHPRELKYTRKGLEDLDEQSAEINGKEEQGQETDDGDDLSDLDD